jgi:hypothetical protein
MAWPGHIARSRRELLGHGRSRRRLAGIERALASEAGLASMFAMFNALNRGERPSGAEPLPRSVWATRPWLTRAAALLAMAAVIAAGLLLSAGMRPMMRTCMMLTAAGRPVAVSGAVPAASAETAGSDHESPCAAYPVKK